MAFPARFRVMWACFSPDPETVSLPAAGACSVSAAVAPLGARAHVVAELDALVLELSRRLRSGDHVLIMSNGGFGGLHTRLLQSLAATT